MPLDMRFLGKIYEQIDFICFPLLGLFDSYRLNLPEPNEKENQPSHYEYWKHILVIKENLQKN